MSCVQADDIRGAGTCVRGTAGCSVEHGSGAEARTAPLADLTGLRAASLRLAMDGAPDDLVAAVEGASALVRTFETGANRDVDEDKPDYEGFLCPLVLQAFAEYMHRNRVLRDGSLRDSDNWQRGMPLEVYMQSGFRHFMDWWLLHRGHPARADQVEAICALLFNAMGYLHELLKAEAAEGGA